MAAIEAMVIAGLRGDQIPAMITIMMIVGTLVIMKMDVVMMEGTCFRMAPSGSRTSQERYRDGFYGEEDERRQYDDDRYYSDRHSYGREASRSVSAS